MTTPDPAAPDAATDVVDCPKCGTPLQDAPGIGPFCPNPKCDVCDGILQAAGLAPPFEVALPVDPRDAEIARLRAEVAELRTAVRVFAGHVEATGPSLRIASEVAGKLMKEPA